MTIHFGKHLCVCCYSYLRQAFRDTKFSISMQRESYWSFDCFQGLRYNFLVEGTIGTPGNVPENSLKGVWGTFEIYFRFAQNNANFRSSVNFTGKSTLGCTRSPQK